jgi:L-lactate dehydrogenase
LKNTKAVIIGAGHVGSHCASALIAKCLFNEIVFIDIDVAKARSQALDLADAAIFSARDMIVRTGDYTDCKDADIIVVCVGTPPDVNRSRMDYLEETIQMVKTIIEPLKNSGFSGVLINISNPADVITHYLQEGTGFPFDRVISTSTMLDTARLKCILSSKMGLKPSLIQAFSMGEHGASQMIPWSKVVVLGRPILQLLEEQSEKYAALNLAEITELTRRAGYEIIQGKGSTEFGIGAALAELAQSIIHDEQKILPVSVLLKGQYGQNDVYASVPAIIGGNGVVEILEIPLTELEITQFTASCEEIRKNYQLVKDY